MRHDAVVGLALVIGVVTVGPDAGAQRRREIDLIVERTLVKPTIKAEAGFSAELLVPPGDLYDPLGLRPRDGTVWIVDDGAQDGRESGGRIWSIDYKGGVSTLVQTARLLPSVGFDIAPQTFGRFGGRLFILTQPRAGQVGIAENHLIQHLDPKSREAVTPLCTLPNAGTIGNGVPAGGLDARFGPPESLFADRLFAVTLRNSTVYQATADGVCRPFVTFEGPWYTASNLDFSADGSRMLAAVRSSAGAQGGGSGPPSSGAVVAVAPDGTIDSQPLVVMQGEPVWSVAVAPRTFGPYAGQMFFSTRPVGDGAAGGKVYRLAPDGGPHLVASGFTAPYGMAFANDALWVTDINQDYLGGGVHWPDGSVVTIRHR